MSVEPYRENIQQRGKKTEMKCRKINWFAFKNTHTHSHTHSHSHTHTHTYTHTDTHTDTHTFSL